MTSIKSVLNILNKYSLNNDAYRLLKYRRKIMRGGNWYRIIIKLSIIKFAYVITALYLSVHKSVTILFFLMD